MIIYSGMKLQIANKHVRETRMLHVNFLQIILDHHSSNFLVLVSFSCVDDIHPLVFKTTTFSCRITRNHILDLASHFYIDS